MSRSIHEDCVEVFAFMHEGDYDRAVIIALREAASLIEQRPDYQFNLKGMTIQPQHDGVVITLPTTVPSQGWWAEDSKSKERA